MKLLNLQNLICVILFVITGINTSFGRTIIAADDQPTCIVSIQSWEVPNSGMIGLYADLESCNSNNFQLSFEWSTGDSSQYIEVAGPGNYCVTITATLLGTTIVETYSGCQDITEPCSVSIVMTEDTLSYTSYGSPVTGTLWSTGETTPSIIINGIGTYSVTLTHEDGCISEGAIVMPDTFCYAFIQEFTDPAGNNYLEAIGDPNTLYTVVWYINSITSTGPTIEITEEGTYTAVLTYENGCIAIVSGYYGPAGLCYAYIIETNSGQGSVLLSIQGQYGELATIQWTGYIDPNNVIDLGEEPTINIFQAGQYCFEATNTEGCVFSNCIYIDSLFIWPDSFCYVWINTSINSDNSITLTAVPSQSGGMLAWSNGATGNSIIVPPDLGYYCVTYSNDSTNCEFISCISLGEVGCDVWITESQGGTTDILLTANSSTSGTYLWSTGETTQSIFVSVDGTYTVTFSDNNGCITTASIDIDIDPLNCNYTINIAIDTINGLASYVVDTANLLGTYFWSDGTLGPILIGFDPNEAYYLFYTGVDGCVITVYAGPGNPSDSTGSGDGSINGIVSEDPDGLAGIIQKILVRNGETPMSGAAVQLKDWNGHVKTKITGTDGFYNFDQLAYGTYELLFIAPGRIPYVRTIVLTDADHNFTINVTVGQNSILKRSRIKEETLTIYPNPAYEFINVELPVGVGNTEIRVFDTSGRQVMITKSDTFGQVKMDISVLISGIYTINIVSGKNVFTGKLVKI